MTPTVAIRFPALSDPDAKITVQTASDEMAATTKTTTIIHYTQTVVTMDLPVATRASVEIPETGLYLIVLVTGSLLMERTGADPIPLNQSTNHCQALYLCNGNYSVAFAPGKHRLVCFAAATEWIKRIKQALPLINEVSATMQPHQVALIFPRYELPDILANYLLSLTYQSGDETAIAELDHFHQLNRIMAYYDRLLARTRKASASRRNYEEVVRDFLRHCKHALLLQERLSVETVATALHVSPKTLNRAFRNVSDGTITPGQMLQRMRMETAHRLLSRNENVSVQETADLLGYADTSAFTKAYRKAWNHLPSEAHRFAEQTLSVIGPYRPE
ncbi:helix-turn-helix transcriptional regulator [Parapedobacter soli]|uniref:helix-turn-helix transcriptional regulator n=1 Tax=Parapedobacter soli TaxID=416955 RepID=UPI0021CAAD79|nr:helix-turn-helix transcriptional regulator [Parapedobacter soli]